MDFVKPRWTAASFLLYTGGLTVLVTAVGALRYLGGSYSSGQLVLWALLILVVLYAIAHGYRLRHRWIAAGVFAFSSVVAWAAFVYALWAWFGWLHPSSFQQPFDGFSVARLSFVLLVLAACIDDGRRFRFPLIALITAFATWYFWTDLISGGGNWSTWVTLIIGLIYLAVAGAMDSPSSFWWHVASGLLIGGALLKWWHHSDLDWALIAVAALVFVSIAYGTRRSSWAVLGAVGLFLSAYHFTLEWSRSVDSVTGLTTSRDWVPYAVFAFVGFLLVALGLKKHGAAAGEPERTEVVEIRRYD